MKTKRINLALQGGGAHGAFTWGVLDRMLDEPWLEIAGISGTSAGALNGAALKAGLSRGGASEARALLDQVWSEVELADDLRMTQWMAALAPTTQPLQRLTEMFSPTAWLSALTRTFSPYDYGIFYSNPLAPVVEALDFPSICADTGPQFFVSATNVRSGKIRVFSDGEITADVILASACLPTIFRAIEFVDPKTGRMEAFWDGGYTGNPALYPLFSLDLPDDILVVNINPLRRDRLPKTPGEIDDRMSEISFNSSLLRELRAISFVHRLIEDGRIQKGQMKDVLIHMVSDDPLMVELSAATKLMPTGALLRRLKAAGQAAAETFLNDHAGDLNKRTTVDLVELFS